MPSVTFEIEGPLYGYRASLRRAHDPRYKAFKRTVWALAKQAGLPDLTPSRTSGVKLSVYVTWMGAPRIDWKNVYGAVEDAIWSQDRYVTPGGDCGASWDTGEEESAEVTVRWGE